MDYLCSAQVFRIEEPSGSFGQVVYLFLSVRGLAMSRSRYFLPTERHNKLTCVLAPEGAFIVSEIGKSRYVPSVHSMTGLP